MIFQLAAGLLAWLLTGFVLGYIVGGGAKLGGPEDLRGARDHPEEGARAVDTVRRFLDRRAP